MFSPFFSPQVPVGVRGFLLAGSAFLVENHSRACLRLQVDAKLTLNMVSTRGSARTLDLIPPAHFQLVLLGAPLESDQPSGWQLDYRAELGTAPRLGALCPQAPFAQHLPGFWNERLLQLHAPFPLPRH